MFAVIKTGGKQYKVSPGTLLKVERLDGDAGQSIHLSSVLLLNQEGTITVGAPFLNQVQVSATIVEQTRADKIIVFKKKRRQGYRRKAGHRQDITVLRIEEILTAGKTIDSKADISSDLSETKIAKKSKSKEEMDSSVVSRQAETIVPEATLVESTATESTPKKAAKKPAVKVSEASIESTESHTSAAVSKGKKKSSSKSADLDSSAS